MQRVALGLAIILNLGCHGKPGRHSSSTQAAASTGVTHRFTIGESPSQDTTWKQGLAIGANGPIPLIVVDQFGYRAGDAKVAVIRSPQVGYDASVKFQARTPFAVVDKVTGVTVKQGRPFQWNHGATDSSSGDKVWWFDFSEVTRPGTYTVTSIDRQIRSVEFEIGDAVYRRVLKSAVRMFFYQRAGFTKASATAGDDWADSASHMGPHQDTEAQSWVDKTDLVQVRDLHGGWFDAGDYNKYTSFAARAIIVLLRAYDEHPNAFGDAFEIAESGNGIPDLLDEVRWELDWLKRMQNADGSLLCVQGLSSASPPSGALGPSFYGPGTTSATAMGAAAFAYSAKVFGARSEIALKSYGGELAERAGRAWAWANAHPNVTYFNNDESRQVGSAGLAAGQQEMSDSDRLFAKVEAAIYLYELTHDMSLREFVESSYQSVLSRSAPNQWVVDRQEALLYYAQLPGVTATVTSAIVQQFVQNVNKNADQWPMVVGKADPYRAPIGDYTWGSNWAKATQARIYQLLGIYGGNAEMGAKGTIAAEEYVHYIHGVNPLGLVYLTNMRQFGAEHSAQTLFHQWFADGSAKWDEVTESTPGPAPGYLVGGPNPNFALDSCCDAGILNRAYHCFRSPAYALCSQKYSPPLGQPNQKSYLQFNSGWPANSWAVTEPSIAYQAQYVRVLAAYVR